MERRGDDIYLDHLWDSQGTQVDEITFSHSRIHNSLSSQAYFTGAQIGCVGYIKASLTTVFVGGVAAAASYLVVAALESPSKSVIP